MGLCPWRCGTGLAGGPEHLPRSNCTGQATHGFLVANLERGLTPRLRTGHFVVRAEPAVNH